LEGEGGERTVGAHGADLRPIGRDQIRGAAKIEDAGFAFVVQNLRYRFAQELTTRNIPPGSGFTPQELEFELRVHVLTFYGIACKWWRMLLGTVVVAPAAQFAETPEKQIPRGLKPARDDKNKVCNRAAEAAPFPKTVQPTTRRRGWSARPSGSSPATFAIQFEGRS
jgi:hypothetical protein